MNIIEKNIKFKILDKKASDKISETSDIKILDKKISDKTTDKISDKTIDKISDKTTDKISDKTTDKISDKATYKISDKTTDKTSQPTNLKSKRAPYRGCWFKLNNFKCDPAKCSFSHDINTEKQDDYCKEGLKCIYKCNKYHNFDEIINEWKIMKTQINNIKSVIK